VGCLWGFSIKGENSYEGGGPSRSSTAVGLARVARNRCGGERGEARVPRHGNRRIPQLDDSIYRGLLLPIVARKMSKPYLSLTENFLQIFIYVFKFHIVLNSE
jgi:hypothetical protein